MQLAVGHMAHIRQMRLEPCMGASVLPVLAGIGVPLLGRAMNSRLRAISDGGSTGSTAVVEESSSVASCVLLVAGSTVGVGMLALPQVTSPAGFIASTTTLLFTCAYSLLTGLLIAEVLIALMSVIIPKYTAMSLNYLSIYLPQVTINYIAQRQLEVPAGAEDESESSSSPVSLTSMSVQLLGSSSKPFVIGPYLFLQYCLLIAYISKSSELISKYSDLPILPAATLFTTIMGGACFILPQAQMDSFNGALVLLMVVSFLALLGVAVGDVDASRLSETPSWGAILPALPIIALAFVFQNVVPVIVQRLKSDPGKV